MTWNLEGILCSSRELALLNLLTANNVDVGIVTEAEIPASGHKDFNVEGYHSYLPNASDLLKSAKYRVMALVRSALATSTKIRLNLMHAAVQSVWIQLNLQGTPRRQGTRGPLGTWVLIGGLYREWSDLAREKTALSKVREQLQAASAEVDNVVLAGDVNLDTARGCDVRYRRRCLMLAHDSAVAAANMRYLETGITYRSHGQHVREDGKAREHESVLNHICVSKDLVATVNVLTNTTTDHFQLLASV
jgi:exonuclease III